MRFLLDTHALLWYVLADPKLSDVAAQAILDPKNEILVSIASFWEIGIKVSIGKYVLNQTHDAFIDLCLNRYRFGLLQIEPQHTTRVTLTFTKNHKDPFDRLLVAQALSENIPIISADSKFDAYGVTRLW